MIENYSIGLIVPGQGCNEAQMATIIKDMKQIIKLLSKDSTDFKLVLKVAAPNLTQPEQLPAQIVKSMQYLLRCKLELLPKFAAAKHGDATGFLYESLKDCDEVWCCLSHNQGYKSRHRAAMVLRHSRGKPNATHFKAVPAWVSFPSSEQSNPKPKAKQTKGKKKWNASNWK